MYSALPYTIAQVTNSCKWCTLCNIFNFALFFSTVGQARISLLKATKLQDSSRENQHQPVRFKVQVRAPRGEQQYVRII